MNQIVFRWQQVIWSEIWILFLISTHTYTHAKDSKVYEKVYIGSKCQLH